MNDEQKTAMKGLEINLQAGAVVPGTARMLRAALVYLRELEQGGAERHAYWYDVGAGGGYCSACRYKAKDRGRYCQHCGARMDKTRDEKR